MSQPTNRTVRPKIRALRAIVALGILCGMFVSPAPSVQAGHVPGEPYFDLANLPAPDYTGPEIFDGLKQFVADYPRRITSTPSEIQAGQSLYYEMEGLGYDAQTCVLLPPKTSQCNSDVIGRAPTPGLRVVMGIKPGTTRPDEWIMFIGHYDTEKGTIDGAYDNGAGTNFIRTLAREFADIQTNRTLVFAFYNGEEEGLLASDIHAQAIKEAGQQVTAVLGFDMIGIGFPVADPKVRNCMCLFHGADDAAIAQPLLSYVNYDFLGFPGEGVPLSREARLVGANTRNSDESSFNDQGFLTLRWAGMRTAANYIGYHKENDTIQTIIQESCTCPGTSPADETYYEQGVEHFLESVYYTALTLDNHLPIPDGTVTTDGLTVSGDAAASTDPDAAPTTFSWEFGDGATAQGAQATHTYGSPGTYEVTLTVADNLWSQVSETKTFTVTVS